MKSHHKWLWWLASPFILMTAWYLFTQLINPLPSDEKMITHFQAHRAEFETLAKNYRDYNPYDPEQNKILFDEMPENKALMEKAAIIYVHELGSTWFPNPYSAEAAREFEKRRKQAGKNALDFVHPYKSIGFSMERPPFVGLYRNVILFSGMFTVMKDFMYFPEIPKIEEGYYGIRSPQAAIRRDNTPQTGSLRRSITTRSTGNVANASIANSNRIGSLECASLIRRLT